MNCYPTENKPRRCHCITTCCFQGPPDRWVPWGLPEPQGPQERPGPLAQLGQPDLPASPVLLALPVSLEQPAPLGLPDLPGLLASPALPGLPVSLERLVPPGLPDRPVQSDQPEQFI